VQVFIVDIAEEGQKSQLTVFINPEILSAEGEVRWTEGCLSFPGVQEDIDRAAKVTVRALDRDGAAFTLAAEGLLAVAIQHEQDHLRGELMIDHLGPLKKRLVHRKMQKRLDDPHP
jgi:peptide deformylase